MDKIKVLEKGQELEYSFDNLLNYHGVGYPGSSSCISSHE